MAGVPVFDYGAQQRIIDEMRQKSLFFVAGLPKSGTTWVKMTLNAHPDVSCTGEGHFIDSLAPKLQESLEKYNKLINYKNRIALQRFASFPNIDGPNYRFLMASSILLMLAGTEKARRVGVVGEKTPDNYLGLAALTELFPGAKFLFVARDPRDCAVSAWFHNMRLNPDGALQKFPNFAAFTPHVARMWVDAVARWEAFVKMGAAHCSLVRYEDLAARPERELTRLFGFLGVDTNADVVARCVAATSFATLTGGRPAGTEDRSSLLRQGLPGDWTKHFIQTDLDALEAIAGGAMARYGYFPEPARNDARPPVPPALAEHVPDTSSDSVTSQATPAA
jgi:hypothetical protein